MSQTLCKNNEGKRSLAYELLINNTAISNLVRERKISQIYSQIQTGNKEGMNTLNNAFQDWLMMGKSQKMKPLKSCYQNHLQ